MVHAGAVVAAGVSQVHGAVLCWLVWVRWWAGWDGYIRGWVVFCVTLFCVMFLGGARLCSVKCRAEEDSVSVDYTVLYRQ